MNLPASTALFLLLITTFLSPAVYSQSSNCGIIWRSQLPVSSDSVFSDTPHISVTGDTIHVIWYGTDFFGTGTHSGIQYAHSFDGGLTFAPQLTITSADTADKPGFVASSGSNVYVLYHAVLDTFQGTVLARSTDAGNSWLPLQRLRNLSSPKFIETGDSDIYVHYIAQDINKYQMLRSTDNGGTWNTQNAVMPGLESMFITPTKLHAVALLGSDPNDVVYYYSTDAGGTWLLSEFLSVDDLVTSLRPRIAGNDRHELYVVWNDTGSIVMRRSRNSGVSWTPQTNLSSKRGAVFPDISAGHEFVSVVWDNDIGGIASVSIRPSNDFGGSFCPIDFPTPDSGTGGPAITISGNDLHVVWSKTDGISGDIYYRHGTVLNNPDAVDRPPLEFVLKQNFPNPFNGYTHINYEVPLINSNPAISSGVKLTVYNILGQEVEVLVNTALLPGRYDAIFDGSRIASGVYFYQLITDRFIERKKLMIVR